MLKFGGTSVGSAAAISAVVAIVAERTRAHEVVVVVSAMSGVTDALLRGAHSAAAGDGHIFVEIAEMIERKHFDAARELIVDENELRAVESTVRRFLDEFRTLCHSVQVLG
ncbi:MAG TPA: aspartate kinase, partial [Herpetosiphonaceae bacterium]|nr:aspartate kinase [Herpetosiphonaceae bacterium]